MLNGTTEQNFLTSSGLMFPHQSMLSSHLSRIWKIIKSKYVKGKSSITVYSVLFMSYIVYRIIFKTVTHHGVALTKNCSPQKGNTNYAEPNQPSSLLMSNANCYSAYGSVTCVS